MRSPTSKRPTTRRDIALPAKTVDAVVKGNAVRSKPRGATHWSYRSMWLRHVESSPSSVQRIGALTDFSRIVPRRFKLSTNPHFREKR